MDINRTNLNDLYVGYKGNFQAGLRSRENATIHQRIATVIPSSTHKEVYPWLGQWPRMREWLGDRHVKSLTAHRFEIENKTFETTVAVEREAIEDDRFGVYSPMFQELGAAVAEWPADLVFALLKAGETAIGYDGVPFFSGSHPHKIDGPVANVSGSGGTPWYLFDTSRALKPFIWQARRNPNLVRKDMETDDNVFFQRQYIYGVDARGNAGLGLWQLAHKSMEALDKDTLGAAIAAMMELRNDEGSSLGIHPNLLVVPPELMITARELVMAERNDAGATNVLRGSAELLVTNLVREAA